MRIKLARLLPCIFWALALSYNFTWAAETPSDCFHPKTSPDEGALKSAVNLINSFVDGSDIAKKIFPTAWTSQLQTSEVKFNDLANTKFEDGRAYGAVAFQAIDSPFAQAKVKLSQPGFIL